jgi:hypothetical protein
MIIGDLDLLADHPSRILGRGAPRLLRFASSVVLVGAVAGVGLAASGALRAPSWSIDLTRRADPPIASESERASSTITHAELLQLLARIDASSDVELVSADVRRGATDSPGLARGGPMVVLLRLLLAAPDGDPLAQVSAGLRHPALSVPEVLEYSVQVDGAAVTLTFDARMSSTRRGPATTIDDPGSRLPELVREAGADVVAIRLPSSGQSDQEIALGTVGALAELILMVATIEEEVSSPGRIASLSLRRQVGARAALDLRFSLREPLVLGMVNR